MQMITSKVVALLQSDTYTVLPIHCLLPVTSQVARPLCLTKQFLGYTTYNLFSVTKTSKWLLLRWLLHKRKREFSDTNFEIRNLADVSIECFRLLPG